MSLYYTIIGGEDGASITVFLPGTAPLVAHSTHPAYERIVEQARGGQAEGLADLFDPAKLAGTKFRRVTERVSVNGGVLYLDGEPVHNALADQVLRFMEEGVDDWKPLVRFFENVQSNPDRHSREQLYEWLARRAFTITSSGLIVGYKGVALGVDGVPTSISQGTATVDGVVHTGRIPNPLGAVIEMPRGSVASDPSVGCHVGLHVGTYDYANSFARGGLLEVWVNPRDVVSVPTDCDAAKVRCCRYIVIRFIDAPYTLPVIEDEGYEDDDDEDYGCDYCDGCDCGRA